VFSTSKFLLIAKRRGRLKLKLFLGLTEVCKDALKTIRDAGTYKVERVI
jgi:hypothetical protein